MKRHDHLAPRPRHQVKVLGLVWRGDQMLLAEVADDSGRVKGVRPLGGSVEFGETRERALQREFAEELGCGIEIIGPWHGLENIFQHEGATGHEFIFAANIRLDQPDIYAQEEIAFLETDLHQCRAGWFTPTALPAGVALYPEGLLALIERAARSSASPDALRH